jgi:hypothetical protein
VCKTLPLGQVNVFSPVDVSVPGVIECRPVELPDWVSFGFDIAKAGLKVARWLERLPFDL